MVPQCHYNPLNEPSPLGLRLRKSPSLLELAQKRLNQCNSDKDENLEAETKRDLKAKTRARASSSMDKLKASHFPASLLRIGRWEVFVFELALLLYIRGCSFDLYTYEQVELCCVLFQTGQMNNFSYRVTGETGEKYIL